MAEIHPHVMAFGVEKHGMWEFSMGTLEGGILQEVCCIAERRTAGRFQIGKGGRV